MSTWVKIAWSGLSTDDDTPGLTRRTLHTAAASFAQPTTIGGGGDVMSWRDVNGYGPTACEIAIFGSAAATLPGASGLGVYGERFGKLHFLGKLNNGEDIILQGANVGAAFEVDLVGTFERLLLGGISGTVTPTAGTITVKATPLLITERRP